MTRRSWWNLLGLVSHELIYENSSRAWLRDKAESQNTTVLLPYRSGRSPNGPSIPQFCEAPDLEVVHASVLIHLSGIDCPEKWINTAIPSRPALWFYSSPSTLGHPARPLCPSQFAHPVAFRYVVPSSPNVPTLRTTAPSGMPPSRVGASRVISCSGCGLQYARREPW